MTADAKREVQKVALEARNVTFSYQASTSPVLENWSAEFRAGTATALTGPSGRGKSTLLYLLGLMLTPTAGQVFVKGQHVSASTDAVKARTRAELFGFVFQDAALDPSRSVLDNVTETAIYRGESRRRASLEARALLKRFGVDVSPERKPGQVSGGQAQRIALCRALLHKPQILLADEPTGNLDPESAAIVVEGLIAHARGGAAVVIVTHSPEVAAACDRQVQL